MRARSLLAGSVAALAGAALVLPATAQATTSDVHVVHGIPATPVDVCVDDAEVLADFQPNTRTDALALAPGDHEIDLTAVGDDCDSPILTQVVTVPAAGLDLDLVAHLDGDGTPILSAFANDLSPTAPGEARVVARHTAAAPEVDVLAGGAPVIEGIANATPDGAAEEGDVAVPAGTYPINLAPTGTTTGVFAEDVDVTVEAGMQYLVYAVGSLEGESLALYPFAVEVGEIASDRIGGVNREATAVEISRAAYPDGADVVYLANGYNFPDALAAKSLQDGPVLFAAPCGYSDGELLRSSTADEIARLSPDRVVALGGEAAICGDVLDAALAAAAG